MKEKHLICLCIELVLSRLIARNGIKYIALNSIYPSTVQVTSHPVVSMLTPISCLPHPQSNRLPDSRHPIPVSDSCGFNEGVMKLAFNVLLLEHFFLMGPCFNPTVSILKPTDSDCAHWYPRVPPLLVTMLNEAIFN